ncbi:sugar phosphate isomerase/epimerase [Nocardia sp. BMG111209]|uniref:sugar phosphate isomerase/epimerase family protein n=1 Tax=Nocardia sp. BMG111209 TaxID=1160137 RepID=UPI000372ED84|nr:TIM barrel protein [Nocardia sp. BMG111209]
MSDIGIELLSVFGMPPLEFVRLAADLGCRHISCGLESGPPGPLGYPPYSLREDAALRREMIAAMRDQGVSIALGEGMNIRAGLDIRDRATDLALMAELGVRRINTVSLDPDLSRSVDQFAALAELAAAHGMETTVEPSPGLTVGDLPTALDVIDRIGRPDFRLLIDSMHILRSGATPADLARVDPDRIGYIQLSDAPVVATDPNYMNEAMFDRRIPGDGELPLLELLRVLPRDRVIGLEIPLRATAVAGVDAHHRLRPAVDATRALLAELAADDDRTPV